MKHHEGNRFERFSKGSGVGVSAEVQVLVVQAQNQRERGDHDKARNGPSAILDNQISHQRL